MSNVLVNEEYLSGIANAIRAKNGSSDTYTPGQMAAAINDIETGGSDDAAIIGVPLVMVDYTIFFPYPNEDANVSGVVTFLEVT